VNLRGSLRRVIGPRLRRHPRLWHGAIAADAALERARGSAARVLPGLIRAEPRSVDVAVTARCNLRCLGCRYGRDFMPGAELSLPLVRDLLDDAAEAGLWSVRLYGGEPLLHPELPAMVAHACARGLQVYVTTNGLLLERRIDELVAAGLRQVTIGYYGTDAHYDAYVQRRDRFRMLERGIAAVRERHGSAVSMRINWLLMRPSCNLEDLAAALSFARRYELRIQVDLVHYSLPYFTEGEDRALQFRPEDRTAIDVVVAELLRQKRAEPGRFNQSEAGLRSIPLWLLLGPGMRVPCDAGKMLWVGADGSVQLCYVTFPLGNLHEQRLRTMLFTPAHHAAARSAWALDCPNCHCGYDVRVARSPAAVRAAGAAPLAVTSRGRSGSA
jgi:cyclic pyranopterin phosphate synthase